MLVHTFIRSRIDYCILFPSHQLVFQLLVSYLQQLHWLTLSAGIKFNIHTLVFIEPKGVFLKDLSGVIIQPLSASSWQCPLYSSQ